MKYETNIIFSLKLIVMPLMLISALPAYSSSDTTIPGFMCQTQDTAVISKEQLIRTTDGIQNNRSEKIDIYCPVDIHTKDTKLNITISYHSPDANSEGTGPRNLECWLSTGISAVRKYYKFKQKAGGLDGRTHAILQANENDGRLVSVRCKLMANEQIHSIRSKI